MCRLWQAACPLLTSPGMIALSKVKLPRAIVVAAVLAIFPSIAQSITVGDSILVQDLGVSPRQIVKIDVDGFYTGYTYAGVVKLRVDGVRMDGFCIDPYHPSSTSPLLYHAVPLTQAPKSPGTMNASQALLIGALWALAYSPAITADAAAALQLAIWEVVGGDDFTLLSGKDYGAAALLAAAKTYTGPQPNLVGLTGSGQDYVVALPKVSDGGFTALLLGITLIGIAAFQIRLARPRP